MAAKASWHRNCVTVTLCIRAERTNKSVSSLAVHKIRKLRSCGRGHRRKAALPYPKVQLITQYMTSVQPSIVIHWNTVSIARPKLSKLVMPSFGPTQPFWQTRSALFSWSLQRIPRPHGRTGSIPISSVQKGKGSPYSIAERMVPERRGCDLNPGPSAPESSTLTTRLPSHPYCVIACTTAS